MNLRRGRGFECVPRALLAPFLLGFLLIAGLAGSAQAQILPPGFFDMKVTPGLGAAAVEADRLTYDAATGVISADGNAVLNYQGYTIRADRLVYDQNTGKLHAVGNVGLRDPQGSQYKMDSIEVKGGMKDAFIDTLTLHMADGGIITARDVNYSSELQTVLTEASYSPCGLCIDTKGRRIGWKVNAARMTYDHKNAAVYFEQPSLEVLGIPVAWLPWFWIPDPSQPRAEGIRLPQLANTPQRGTILTVPYFIPEGEDVDIILSPTLMTRQGFLMRGDAVWRFPTLGEIDISASGLRQLDKSAYAGTVGDRDWRGAIQVSGRFTPAKDWTAGWSYSAFSDNAYLSDYTDVAKGDISTNQVYGTYLTGDTYLDARLQHFNTIGNTPTDDPTQANTLPVVKFNKVQDLAEGDGRISLSGELLSVYRPANQASTVNGVSSVTGYEGNKQHLELEAAYENQWILPGGVTATPYLGARLDAARFDGSIPPPPGYPAQGDANLLSLTPIAAMDLRWPLMATNGSDTHLVEPILQLVYRGSSTTNVGVTNDDAQSFVFDTSNLFSYNRFSGIDRQETGLRANVGGHYLGSFADGSWLDLVAGESFHLLGPNALGTADPTLVGTSTGLGTTDPYIVAGGQGSYKGLVNAGGKVQIDPAAMRVTRAGVTAGWYAPWFSVSTNYIYLAKNPALGVLADEHEVGVGISVPVADYWTLSGSYQHNIGSNTWAGAAVGVVYDDGYFTVSGTGSASPTSYAFGVHLGLKGPLGSIAF